MAFFNRIYDINDVINKYNTTIHIYDKINSMDEIKDIDLSKLDDFEQKIQDKYNIPPNPNSTTIIKRTLCHLNEQQ